MLGTSFSYKCNPALFPYSDSEGIFILAAGKADGDSIDNGRDLIFDPITEPLIRRLFEEKNFNSFTFNGEVIFKNSLFEISYNPYYLLADLFIFNPAFPEISLHLVNRETISLASGYELFKSNHDDNWSLSLGGRFYYYEHMYENTVFSLFDLSTQRPEDLISFDTEYGVAADLGLFFKTPGGYLPNLSYQVKNINSSVKRNREYAESSIRQDTLFLFDTHMLVGIGNEYKTDYGLFNYELLIPIEEYFEYIREDYSTLAFRYTLRFISIYTGFSDFHQSLGIQFLSRYFNVGVTYTREKDIGDIQNGANDAVYTGIDIIL